MPIVGHIAIDEGSPIRRLEAEIARCEGKIFEWRRRKDEAEKKLAELRAKATREAG